MRRRVVQLGLGVFLVLALVACSTFVRDSYRTLVVSQQSYDVTLQSMGDLYKAGKVTDAQRDKAIEIGRGYKIAHNGAVAALVKYDETNADPDKTVYIQAAAVAAGELAKLLAYCQPFLTKGGN